MTYKSRISWKEIIWKYDKLFAVDKSLWYIKGKMMLNLNFKTFASVKDAQNPIFEYVRM